MYYKIEDVLKFRNKDFSDSYLKNCISRAYIYDIDEYKFKELNFDIWSEAIINYLSKDVNALKSNFKGYEEKSALEIIRDLFYLNKKPIITEEVMNKSLPTDVLITERLRYKHFKTSFDKDENYGTENTVKYYRVELNNQLVTLEVHSDNNCSIIYQNLENGLTKRYDNVSVKNIALFTTLLYQVSSYRASYLNDKLNEIMNVNDKIFHDYDGVDIHYEDVAKNNEFFEKLSDRVYHEILEDLIIFFNGTTDNETEYDNSENTFK